MFGLKRSTSYLLHLSTSIWKHWAHFSPNFIFGQAFMKNSHTKQNYRNHYSNFVCDLWLCETLSPSRSQKMKHPRKLKLRECRFWNSPIRHYKYTTKLLPYLGSTLHKLIIWNLESSRVPKTSLGESKYCFTASKILRGDLQFCLTVSKILWRESQFCLTVPKILWVTPRAYPILWTSRLFFCSR